MNNNTETLISDEAIAKSDLSRLLNLQAGDFEIEENFKGKMIYIDYDNSHNCQGRLIIHQLAGDIQFRVSVCEYDYMDAVDLFETQDIERVKQILKWVTE